MLNADSYEVHILWSEIKKLNNYLSKSIVWVGKDKSLLITKSHYISLPLVANKVFDVLDSFSKYYEEELFIRNTAEDNNLFTSLLNNEMNLSPSV